MAPSVAHRLRDIAGELRARVEEGEFVGCLGEEGVQSLPSALEALARELDGAPARAGGAW